MRLEGKVALITGGAQGIGKEIALHFAKEKAKVVIFDLDEARIKEAVDELSAVSQAQGYKVNVTDLKDVEENLNKVVDNFGRIDILINNAGITKDNLLIRLSESDWDNVLAVNLKGVFNCTKIASKFMIKQRYGRIINISSVIGIMGNPGQVNYAASKAGIIGVTKTLAKELGARNVTVNAIAPGYIKTAMTDKLSDKAKEAMVNRISLNRLGQPADVANAAVFLASSDADYITGQVLVVDGGLV